MIWLIQIHYWTQGRANSKFVAVTKEEFIHHCQLLASGNYDFVENGNKPGLASNAHFRCHFMVITTAMYSLHC
jgi:hypothetical protein